MPDNAKTRIALRNTKPVDAEVSHSGNGHNRTEVTDQVVKAAVGYIFNPTEDKMVEVTNLPLDQIRPLSMTLTTCKEIKKLCEYIMVAQAKYKNYRNDVRQLWFPVDANGNEIKIETPEQFRVYAEQVGLLWEQPIEVKLSKKKKICEPVTVVMQPVDEPIQLVDKKAASPEDELLNWNMGMYNRPQPVKQTKLVKTDNKKTLGETLKWALIGTKTRNVKSKKVTDISVNEDEKSLIFAMKQEQLLKAFQEFKRRQNKFSSEVEDDSDFTIDTENIKLMMGEFVYHYCQARRSLHGDLMFSGITVSRDQIMSQGNNDGNLFGDARSQ